MKKIVAFYDVLLYAIICIPFIIGSILIFIFGELTELDWIIKYWYLVVAFGCGIMIPVAGILFLRYFIIHNNESAYFHLSPFMYNWNKVSSTNNIDIRWNQNVFISEVKSIEIVKLSKNEKNKIYFKHLFNKYLKINLKYGNPKYVYVGNYSDFQINKIIRMICHVE